MLDLSWPAAEDILSWSMCTNLHKPFAVIVWPQTSHPTRVVYAVLVMA